MSQYQKKPNKKLIGGREGAGAHRRQFTARRPLRSRSSAAASDVTANGFAENACVKVTAEKFMMATRLLEKIERAKAPLTVVAVPGGRRVERGCSISCRED